MQFVFFAAGAAVLEVHRALHKPPGDPDVEAIQKREAELKAALEVNGLAWQHASLRSPHSRLGPALLTAPWAQETLVRLLHSLHFQFHLHRNGRCWHAGSGCNNAS